MKKYCLDTSGFTNPYEKVPHDIYVSLWRQIIGLVDAGMFAVTAEVYDELTHITGELGEYIKKEKAKLVLEIGGGWDSAAYIGHSSRMSAEHRRYISDYIAGRPKRTICLIDMSGIALAKATGLPLISMETSTKDSTKYKRIPDICNMESVEHMDFNDLLRKEKITV